MIKDIKTHFWHYAVLIFILAIGGIGFFLSSDKIIKFQIGTLSSLAYILWGIFHHRLRDDLKAKIVVEYALIGVLAMIFLEGILL